MDDYSTKNVKEPVFKIGDKIEFEVACGTNYARWNYSFSDSIGKDLGASGLWATGKVVDPVEYLGKNRSNFDKLSKEWLYVKYSIVGMIGDGYAIWPLKGNFHYKSWQWARPGFIKHPPRCECGAESVYGKDTNLHSFWCERKEIGAKKK